MIKQIKVTINGKELDFNIEDKNVCLRGNNSCGKTQLTNFMLGRESKSNAVINNQFDAGGINIDVILSVFKRGMGRKEQIKLSKLLKIPALEKFNAKLVELIENISSLQEELLSEDYNQAEAYEIAEMIKGSTEAILDKRYKSAIKKYNDISERIKEWKMKDSRLKALNEARKLLESIFLYDKSILTRLSSEIDKLSDEDIDIAKCNQELVDIRSQITAIENIRAFVTKKDKVYSILNRHQDLEVLKSKKSDLHAEINEVLDLYVKEITTSFAFIGNKLLPAEISLGLITNKRGKVYTNQLVVSKNGKKLDIKNYASELSESTIRLIALTVLLTVLKKENQVGSTIILDDVFNTLDDNNIKTLFNLISYLFEGYQLFYLTHSDHIMDMMQEEKFVIVEIEKETPVVIN